MIMEAGESKICSVGQQAWDPGELMMVKMKSESYLLENSLFLWEATLFVLSRLSNNLMSLIHIMEGSLLYPEFTDLNVNCIPKHLPS